MPDLASQVVCSEWRLASDRRKDRDCLSGTVKGSKASMTRCGELRVTEVDHYEASSEGHLSEMQTASLSGGGGVLDHQV